MLKSDGQYTLAQHQQPQQAEVLAGQKTGVMHDGGMLVVCAAPATLKSARDTFVYPVVCAVLLAYAGLHKHTLLTWK